MSGEKKPNFLIIWGDDIGELGGGRAQRERSKGISGPFHTRVRLFLSPSIQPSFFSFFISPGISNISAYSEGLMGYRTPNIDRVGKEGIRFTDYYGEQSCTAGRAAFLTGQNPYRTGLTKVGMPGAKLGLSEEDPTMAQAMKAQGYGTGQFGKNHLGDLDG